MQVLEGEKALWVSVVEGSRRRESSEGTPVKVSEGLKTLRVPVGEGSESIKALRLPED